MVECNKKDYEDIFIVLTYKNTVDILDLLKSLSVCCNNYRVIIVNSFYSEDTKESFEKIALTNDCDFIAIENKGYGYGNNIGIDFAMKHYDFKRIIISNPDIIVKKYNQKELDSLPTGVYGGVIENAKGKKQNPLRVNDLFFTNNSAYYRYVKNNNTLFLMSVITAKLQRFFSLIEKKDVIRVFAVHGSFFIICRDVLNKMTPFFDDKIFMFQEEIDVAKTLKMKKIPVYFTRQVFVYHKEDGDVNSSNINNSKIMRESCNYIIKKWYSNSVSG